MYNIKMNTQFGTKWFTFFTKVRPWICCFSLFLVAKDFIKHIDSYLNNWWLLLYFLFVVYVPILSIMIFNKSKGDYLDFVQFVKKALIFETISFTYQYCIKIYMKTGFKVVGILIPILILVLIDFFWYKCNMAYFKKRINGGYMVYSTSCRKRVLADTNLISNSDLKESFLGLKKSTITENSLFSDDANKLTLPKPKKNLQRIRYCGRCGNLIDNETRVCSGCGKQYFKLIKFKQTHLLIFILSIIICVSSIMNAVQVIKMNNLLNQLNYRQHEIEDLNGRILNLGKALTKSNSKYDSCQISLSFYEDYVACLNENSKKYHKYGCEDFNTSSFSICSKKMAEQIGYFACKKCHKQGRAENLFRDAIRRVAEEKNLSAMK